VFPQHKLHTGLPAIKHCLFPFLELHIGHLAMYIPSCHITVWFCLLFSWALLRSAAAWTANDQPEHLNFQLFKKLKNAEFIPL
jgi:hypothetical protein